MNSLIPGASIIALVASTVVVAAPVTETRVWTESYPVSSDMPHLFVNNIWGNVRVRPGTAGEITVTINELRTAPDQERFDRSQVVLGLDIDSDADGVSFDVGGEFRGWGGGNRCRGCRVDYHFDILVPEGTNVDVGTVMDGRVDVSGIAGNVSASNVNGPIAVAELSDCEALESVNGAVVLSFVSAPVRDCSIETINGDITINMPDGTGLDVALDLFNGRMLSEFHVNPFSLPADVEHTTDNGQNHYRIQQSAGLRVEGGGPTFSISSLNGDINIQKSQ